VGCIQYIDQFGNLVTNIPSTFLKNKSWYVQIGSLRINSYSTYTEVYLGEILALISSHGWVEIAVNQGNAQLRLQVELGKKISVEW
jgi:S-adenosylmethionine hydrolase